MNLEELQIKIGIELKELNKQLKKASDDINKHIGPKATKKLMADNNKVIKRGLDDISRTTMYSVKKMRKDTTKEVDDMSKDINKSLTKAFDINLTKFNKNIDASMAQAKRSVKNACNDIRRELNAALNVKANINVSASTSAQRQSSSSRSDAAAIMASSQYTAAMIVKAVNGMIDAENKNTTRLEGAVNKSTNKIVSAINKLETKKSQSSSHSKSEIQTDIKANIKVLEDGLRSGIDKAIQSAGHSEIEATIKVNADGLQNEVNKAIQSVNAPTFKTSVDIKTDGLQNDINKAIREVDAPSFKTGIEIKTSGLQNEINNIIKAISASEIKVPVIISADELQNEVNKAIRDVDAPNIKTIIEVDSSNLQNEINDIIRNIKASTIKIGVEAFYKQPEASEDKAPGSSHGSSNKTHKPNGMQGGTGSLGSSGSSRKDSALKGEVIDPEVVPVEVFEQIQDIIDGINYKVKDFETGLVKVNNKATSVTKTLDKLGISKTGDSPLRGEVINSGKLAPNKGITQKGVIIPAEFKIIDDDLQEQIDKAVKAINIPKLLNTKNFELGKEGILDTSQVDALKQVHELKQKINKMPLGLNEPTEDYEKSKFAVDYLYVQINSLIQMGQKLNESFNKAPVDLQKAAKQAEFLESAFNATYKGAQKLKSIYPDLAGGLNIGKGILNELQPQVRDLVKRVQDEVQKAASKPKRPEGFVPKQGVPGQVTKPQRPDWYNPTPGVPGQVTKPQRPDWYEGPKSIDSDAIRSKISKANEELEATLSELQSIDVQVLEDSLASVKDFVDPLEKELKSLVEEFKKIKDIDDEKISLNFDLSDAKEQLEVLIATYEDLIDICKKNNLNELKKALGIPESSKSGGRQYPPAPPKKHTGVSNKKGRPSRPKFDYSSNRQRFNRPPEDYLSITSDDDDDIVEQLKNIFSNKGNNTGSSKGTSSTNKPSDKKATVKPLVDDDYFLEKIKKMKENIDRRLKEDPIKFEMEVNEAYRKVFTREQVEKMLGADKADEIFGKVVEEAEEAASDIKKIFSNLPAPSSSSNLPVVYSGKLEEVKADVEKIEQKAIEATNQVTLAIGDISDSLKQETSECQKVLDNTLGGKKLLPPPLKLDTEQAEDTFKQFYNMVKNAKMREMILDLSTRAAEVSYEDFYNMLKNTKMREMILDLNTKQAEMSYEDFYNILKNTKMREMILDLSTREAEMTFDDFFNMVKNSQPTVDIKANIDKNTKDIFKALQQPGAFLPGAFKEVARLKKAISNLGGGSGGGGPRLPGSGNFTTGGSNGPTPTDTGRQFDSHVAIHKAVKAYEQIKEKLNEIKDEYKKMANTISKVTNKITAPLKKISSGLKGVAGGVKTAWNKITSIFKKGAKDCEKATNGLSLKLKDLLKTALSFVSIYGLINIGKQAIVQSGELAQSEAKLAALMKQRMGATNDTIKAVKQLASEQAKLGVVSEAAMVKGAEQLSMYVHSAKALETLMPAIANMTARRGGFNATPDDAMEIATQLGEAIREGTTTPLEQSGIYLSEAEIKKFQALRTEEERANFLAAQIAKNVGNINEALANTPHGQIAQLKNNFKSLLGTLGTLLVNVIQPIVKWLNVIVVAATNALKALGELLGFDMSGGGLMGVGDVGTGTAPDTGGIDDVGDSLDDAKDSAEEAEEAVEKFKGSLMGFDEINILSNNLNDKDKEEDDPTNITPGEGGQLDPGEYVPPEITEGENIFTKFGEKMKAFLDEFLEPFKAAWDLLGDDLKAEWADLIESFKHFCDSLGSFLKSVWDNGGKEFVQHMAEIALACAKAAMEIGGEILDSLARLWDHLDPSKNMHTQRLLDVLNEVSEKIRDFILGLGDHFESLMANGGQDVLNAMGDCFMDLGAAAVNGLGVAIDALDGLIDHLDPAVNENTRNMLQALADMFHAVGEAAWDFSELLRSALENGGQDMINAFGDMMMNLGETVARVITTMMESFSKFFEYIDPENNDITRAMMKAWEEAFLAIGDMALGFAELFESVMANGGQDVLNKLGDAFNSLVGLVGTCVKEIADAMNGLFEHLDPKTNEFTQNMLKAWEKAFESISGMAKDIGEVLGSVMDNGGQEVVNAIGDLGVKIVGAFGKVTGTVADCVGDLFKHLDPAENKIAKGALESFEYFINSIGDFVDSLADALGTFMDNGGQEFVNNMGDIIALIGDLAFTIGGDILNAISTFMDSWLGHAVISTCATALELVSEVLKGLLEILEPLSPIISGVVAAFAGFQVASKVVGFISSIVSAFQALGGAGGILALVKGGFTALWAVLSANPIAAIVAAIVGIGVAIVALYNKCEGFREFIDGILKGFQDLFNELKEHFSNLLEDVRNIFGNVIDIITGIFEGDGEKVGEAVRNLILNLVDLMMDMNKAFVEVGWALIKGLVQGIWECIKALPSLLAGFLEFVVDFFKGLFGIHSPSTVFAELGVNLIEGLVKGILDSINSVTEAFKKIGDAIFGTIKDIAKTVSDKFKEIKDGIKDRLKETKEVVSEKWKEIKETVSEKAKATYEVAKENWANIKDTVSEKSKEAYNAIKENWKEVKQTATDIFTETYNVTKEKWADIKDTVKERAKETYEAAKDNWTNLKQNTTDRFKDIYDTVKDKFTNIRDTVKEKATKTFEDVSASWTKIKDDAATKLEQIKTDAEKRYEDVKNTLVNKIEEAKKGIVEKWEEVRNKTNECIENVRQTSEEKYNEIKETIVERLEDIKSSTEKKWEEIKKNTGTAVENIKKEAETQYAKIKDSLVDTLEKTKSAMATKWDSIKSDAVSKVSAMANEVSNKFAEIKTKLSSKLDEVKSTLSSKWESIKTQTSNAASKISTSAATAFDGISSKASKALDSARTSVSNGLSKITSLFKNTKWSLPSFKLPKIEVTGKFSLNPPSAPSFKLNWNARGGIIDGITPLGFAGGALQMGGEAGKEMVVPLENTSFTSKIAQAMGQAVDNAMARNYNNMNNNNNSTNENRDVVLQLDGREFARASINQINKLQRESGRTLLDV